MSPAKRDQFAAEVYVIVRAMFDNGLTVRDAMLIVANVVYDCANVELGLSPEQVAHAALSAATEDKPPT